MTMLLRAGMKIQVQIPSTTVKAGHGCQMSGTSGTHWPARIDRYPVFKTLGGNWVW